MLKLKSQECPNCGGTGLELQTDGRAICQYCGTPYTTPGPICPNCEEINPEEAVFCQNCGQSLSRTCPLCQTANWVGAEVCIKCGRSLDMLTQLAERWKQDTAARLDERLRETAVIKEIEQAEAERRSAMFAELEERRQRELNIALAMRARRERQVIGCTLAGVIIFLIAAVVMVIKMLSG